MEKGEADMLLSSLIPENPTRVKIPGKTQLCLAIEEAKCLVIIVVPMVLTGLLLYSRSMVPMLFLGRLGELALAGGSLAVGFANITGYSVLCGLAMGMEPICGQAFGSKSYKLLGLTHLQFVQGMEPVYHRKQSPPFSRLSFRIFNAQRKASIAATNSPPF
ncbi:hypothetical protein SLE2022_228330 [Rubroshorea leprosula]